jgi:hypothetical protein
VTTQQDQLQLASRTIITNPVRTNLSINEFLKMSQEEFHKFSTDESVISTHCQGEES